MNEKIESVDKPPLDPEATKRVFDEISKRPQWRVFGPSVPPADEEDNVAG